MAYHWFKVFESEEALKNNIAPGRWEVFNLKGEKICLVHGIDGFYAIQEKCPHNGALLSHGFCTKDNEIVCPLHRYRFDLKSGKCTAGAGYALITYPVSIKANGVFIGIKAKWWEM